MDLGLRGRGVLVTGGSKGIGAGIARAFAEEGALVAIGARTRAALEETAARIAADTGATVLPIPLDVTNAASVRSFVDAATQAFGRVDILVNCAVDVVGGAAGSPSEISPEALAGGIDVKVLGALRMAQAALPAMRERQWGRTISLGGGAA